MTENNKAHSPLPWGINEISNYGDCHIYSKESGHIAMLTCGSGDEIARNKANADHIVHCVNSHGTLIAALKRIVLAQYLGWEQDDTDEHNASLKQAEEALNSVGVL